MRQVSSVLSSQQWWAELLPALGCFGWDSLTTATGKEAKTVSVIFKKKKNTIIKAT